MRPEEVKNLLTGLEDGTTSVDDALAALQRSPVEDLGFAKVDVHRELRQGLPEAIYAASKTPEQVVSIARRLLERTTGPVIATKVPDATATALLEAHPHARHDASGRVVVLRTETDARLGSVAVVCAGTSDLPIASEAAVTAEAVGASVERVTDVGVAGVHRALDASERLRTTDVVIVVAGMDGALPSVIGGLIGAPIIAVPTSVGYGASFHGLAALLTMLNSCAAGITVVNIDNGFGAALAATRILRARR